MTRVSAISDEATLVRYALGATAPQVEERCRQIRNVHPDSVHDARRAWGARSLSAWRNVAAGTLCLRVELPLDVGELVMKAIERALTREEIPSGAAEGSPECFLSQQADALVAIATTYLEGGSASPDTSSTADRYQLVVHVDEAALHGGAGRADVPLETVKRIACDASVVVVTEDEHGTPLTISRKQRIVSPALRRALVARDRCCRFPGCHRTRSVQAHHVAHWVDGGETTVDNLMLLCRFHHRSLHEGGYRIRCDYRGEYYFVRADGRVIPRCGYRESDYTDDDGAGNPSMEGSEDGMRTETSMEVREPRGIYRMTPCVA